MGGTAAIRYCICAVHVCQGQPDPGSGYKDSSCPENPAPTAAFGSGLCASGILSAIPGYTASGTVEMLGGRLL